MTGTTAAGTRRPLWLRILNFPLLTLVVAVAVFILVSAAGIWLGRLVPPIGRGPTAAVHTLISVALLFIAYKVVIAHLGDRPRDDLCARNAARDLGLGLLIGFVLFSLIVGAAAAVGVYRIEGSGNTSELLLDLATITVGAGFTEELLFRGILFRWIEEFAGSWAALAITSALFGLAHILNPNATWFSSFAIAVEAGILLGGAYMLTRSLWMPIGLHAAWNFTQGFLFDVPVSGHDENGLVQARLSGPEILSGGQFGLEASLIALILATVAGLWLVLLAVRRGRLVDPWWVTRRRLADAGGHQRKL